MGKVLVVDDSPICRKMMVKSISKASQVVLEGGNGQEAVDKVTKLLQNREVLDGILIDYSMPVMDGVEATKAIRALGYRGRIVMVTGNALQEDVGRALAAGVDEVYIKPLKPNDFLNIARGTKLVLNTSHTMYYHINVFL
jgi:CheY-like chemotaxis protein